MVAAVDDLVDVAERDVLRGDAQVGQEPDLLERAGAGLAMRQDRRAGPAMGRRGGREYHAVARRRAAVTAGNLDHAGPMGGPVDDRPGVVISVDALGDVGDEQVGQLLDCDPVAPVRWAVVPLVVEPGRGNDLDAGPARHLGELLDVPARVARHRVDDRPQPDRHRGLDLGRHPIDVAEIEVGVHLDRPPAVDDEMLVGVGDPELGRVDVAEDGSDERHAPASGSGETDTTDQPPSILSSCPVTTRDSSDRK